MRLRTTLALALLSTGCSRTLGDLSPDDAWPPILDEYADYQGTGGAQPGDRIAPFRLPDQTGADTDFRQFLGFVTVIQVGALWSAPCQEAAQTQQAFFEDLNRDPAWILSVLVQGTSGGPPDVGDAATWAQRFGLELPVLADLFQEHQVDWQIEAWPTTLIVAPDGTVLVRHDDVVTEDRITEDVAQALQDHAAMLRTR